MVKFCVPMQRAWVPSLVRKLRSHMPCGMAKNKQKTNFSCDILCLTIGDAVPGVTECKHTNKEDIKE